MDGNHWYLLKVAGNEIFGPAPLDQLRIWAAEAKISPMDRVSNDDRRTWMRAPMVTALQMDWLVEMSDNFLYGPTSVGTLQEFLATGEIDENVSVINTLEGTKTRLSDLPFFKASPHRVRGTQEISLGYGEEFGTGEANANLKQRCLWLEKQVMELQREVGAWSERCHSLRQQFVEMTGRDPR
ncbi:hypothetical protein [Verrucomicrobium sp. BvORR106]|uniref:hypothetical protein n=1 Tax=Verrucomicrobium sp. BvORR106 TaxID=1403819 RepID=UPI00056E2FC4|nr:hypothetical protein [Verrucomicrobium sp. BvORR106]